MTTRMNNTLSGLPDSSPELNATRHGEVVHGACQRELFPMPQLPTVAQSCPGASYSIKRRLAHKRQAVTAANEVISVLNELNAGW
eukprot:8025432-Karenia_brevis.AAC.1